MIDPNRKHLFMPKKKSQYTPEVAKRFIEALQALKGEAPAAEVYKKLEILPSYVSQIASGDKFPTIEHLVKLSSYYKFSAEWLLLGRGDKRWDTQSETINDRLNRMEGIMDNMAEMIASLTVRGIAGASIGIGSSLGPKKR